MDLDKIGSVVGAMKMISGKPQKTKSSGWGWIILGVAAIAMWAFVAFAPEDTFRIEGDRSLLFAPLLFGVIFTVGGTFSVILGKKKQQRISAAKNSGIRYQGYITGVRRTGLSVSDGYNNMIEQNDVIIEVQTPQGVKEVKVRLAGVNEHNFIKYRLDPTPITIYVDSSDPDNLVADEDEVIAAANSTVEAIGEMIDRREDRN